MLDESCYYPSLLIFFCNVLCSFVHLSFPASHMKIQDHEIFCLKIMQLVKKVRILQMMIRYHKLSKMSVKKKFVEVSGVNDCCPFVAPVMGQINFDNLKFALTLIDMALFNLTFILSHTCLLYGTHSQTTHRGSPPFT